MRHEEQNEEERRKIINPNRGRKGQKLQLPGKNSSVDCFTGICSLPTQSQEEAQAGRGASIRTAPLCADTGGICRDRAPGSRRLPQNNPHKEALSLGGEKNSSTQSAIKICKGICLKKCADYTEFQRLHGSKMRKASKKPKDKEFKK